ncbi:MAG: hypothetical protein RQ867_05265 [Mariprofundaceae bacterium]|nr:hypothetical protein [Mariprofundaceae bacterium]
MANFAFLENLMTDTFISDKHVWDEILKLTAEIYSERDLNIRLEFRKKRVRKFFDFILERYQPLVEESQRRGLPREWCINPLDMLQDKLGANLDRAARSALRLHPEGDFEGLNHRNLSGVVSKYDPSKKFAFIALEEESQDGYVSHRVIERTDESLLQEGKRVVCSVIDGDRGNPEVINIGAYVE